MIRIQIIYGFHGPNHQIIEKSRDITPVTNGRTRTNREKWQKEQYCGRPETAKASVCG